MSAPKMPRIESAKPRSRVTAPLATPPSASSASSSTSRASSLLALTTAVRRHVFSYCENGDLILLYAASKTAAAAVVDHTRTTSLVVFAPPPAPSWAAFTSTTATMLKFAFELPFRYPSASAHLTIRALWAAPSVGADDRSDTSTPIQHHRAALAAYCAKSGRAERIEELTIDRHAVSGTLLSRVGDYCTNLVHLHLVDGARPLRSPGTLPVAWPNDFVCGQELVHLGPCLRKRAPTLHALTLEFTDTKAGTADATAGRSFATQCHALANMIGTHLGTARHLRELRMDAASSLLISRHATPFSADSLAARRTVSPIGPLRSPAETDVIADAITEAAETSDSGTPDDRLPLQILQLRFLYDSISGWFEHHVAAQLATSGAHLREVDIETAGGVVMNSQTVLDENGHAHPVPDLPPVVMPHLVRLRLWSLERSPSVPQGDFAGTTVDNPWRIFIAAPHLEELRCNVLAHNHFCFLLDHATDNRLRVLEYAPPRHPDEPEHVHGADGKRNLSVEVSREAARVHRQLEQSAAFWLKHITAGRVSRLERFSWALPLADDVMRRIAACTPAMCDFCAVVRDDRGDNQRDQEGDARQSFNMAARLRQWPLLERLHLTTHDGNPASEAAQRETVPLQELRRRRRSSPASSDTKSIEPVRLDRLHTLVWDPLWSHDLDEWLRAPNLVHLGSVAAPLLTSLIPFTPPSPSSLSALESSSSSSSPNESTVVSSAMHPHLATLALRIFKAPGNEVLAWPAGACERTDPSTAYEHHEHLRKLDVTLETVIDLGFRSFGASTAAICDATDLFVPCTDGLARAFGKRLVNLRMRLLGPCEPGAIAYEWPALVAALTRASPHLPALVKLEIAVPHERRHKELTSSAVAEAVAALGLALLPALDRLDLPRVTPSQLYEINRVLPRGVCANLARVWPE